MERFEYYIETEYIDERIDIFLAEQFNDYSRSFIQNLIANEKVKVNGKLSAKKNYRLSLGDEVEIEIPDPDILDIVPEDIPLDIVYEDDDIMVINKEQGMVVHPAPGNYTGTLVNAIMFYSSKLSSINGIIRPGIVHRIDKNTSGLIVVAKNDFAHHHLSDELKSHDIERIYYAIVHGKVTKEGKIDRPVARNPKNRLKMAIVSGGREAITHYEPIKYFGNDYTLLRVKLETGRTHQIRVHLQSIGFPILGDPVYGVKKEKIKHDGQLLHAKELHLKHPRTGEMMTFVSELPAYYQEIINKLEKIYGGNDGI
ncbi:MAG: RluA family pseudouridine synthase [Clostridiales bacterium]|nr:RluA family pseudouridine synthase [Clostridiales bacterium]